VWPPNSKAGRGEAELTGEMREKYWLVEATFQMAPNRLGTWAPHCSRVAILARNQKWCGGKSPCGQVVANNAGTGHPAVPHVNFHIMRAQGTPINAGKYVLRATVLRALGGAPKI
jgi:hypothetical protein